MCATHIYDRKPGGVEVQSQFRRPGGVEFWEYSGETKSVEIIQRVQEAGKAVSGTPA